MATDRLLIAAQPFQSLGVSTLGFVFDGYIVEGGVAECKVVWCCTLARMCVCMGGGDVCATDSVQLCNSGSLRAIKTACRWRQHLFRRAGPVEFYALPLSVSIAVCHMGNRLRGKKPQIHCTIKRRRHVVRLAVLTSSTDQLANGAGAATGTATVFPTPVEQMAKPCYFSGFVGSSHVRPSNRVST